MNSKIAFSLQVSERYQAETAKNVCARAQIRAKNNFLPLCLETHLICLKNYLSLILSQKLPTNTRKKMVFQQAMSIKSGAGQKNRGSLGETLAIRGFETTAVVQKSTTKTKYRNIACVAIFFPPCLRQAATIYVPTSHNVVRQETIEISEQRTTLV